MLLSEKRAHGVFEHTAFQCNCGCLMSRPIHEARCFQAGSNFLQTETQMLVVLIVPMLPFVICSHCRSHLMLHDTLHDITNTAVKSSSYLAFIKLDH